MPDIDGLTLVRQYRETAATRDIPVVVLSTKEEPLVRATLKNNFDSQNVMFWSEVEQRYVLFARHTEAGFRAQSRATSPKRGRETGSALADIRNHSLAAVWHHDR